MAFIFFVINPARHGQQYVKSRSVTLFLRFFYTENTFVVYGKIHNVWFSLVMRQDSSLAFLISSLAMQDLSYILLFTCCSGKPRVVCALPNVAPRQLALCGTVLNTRRDSSLVLSRSDHNWLGSAHACLRVRRLPVELVGSHAGRQSGTWSVPVLTTWRRCCSGSASPSYQGTGRSCRERCRPRSLEQSSQAKHALE